MQVFTPETLALLDTACQAASNAKCGTGNWAGSWKEYIGDPLAYTYYTDKFLATTSPLYKTLEAYEQTESSFYDTASSEGDMIGWAQASVKAVTQADVPSWSDRATRSKASLVSIGSEIVSVEGLIQVKFEAFQSDFMSVITKATAQIQGLQNQIKNAKTKALEHGFFHAFLAVFDIIKAGVAVAACTTGACDAKAAWDGLKSVVPEIKSAVHDFTNCDACKPLQSQIDQLKKQETQLDTLAQMIDSTQALTDQISNRNQTLPEALPALYTDKIGMDSIRDWLSVMQDSITATGGTQTSIDVQDWMSLSGRHVQLLFSWYDMASRIQDEEGQIQALKTRAIIVGKYVNDEAKKRAALVQAAKLITEQKEKQVMLMTKYLYEEYKQFNYLSLGLAPELSLPAIPTTADFNRAQNDLLTAQMAFDKAEATRAVTKTWLNYVVNVTQENTTLSTLQQTGSTVVDIPIPLINGTVADTNYYEVRLKDVRVYLLPQAAQMPAGQQTKLYIEKQGTSFFLDKDLKLNVFSHPRVQYSSFTYSTEYCPETGSGCGDLCSDYINYSPYGSWKITVPNEQGIDMSKVTGLHFEFSVTYAEIQSPSIRPWFGKHYPGQLLGPVCTPGKCAMC